ncbi:MAG: metallophosphoesterase family protein [Rhodoplanes sp.]|uniref:metallophosphoesterase family protein n=1 Tax=Rhodoplanes sp. TaxID=1968906 RepID=UPI0018238CB6|nr:metallophosphoesterase family protein [Rhodoplanes sp.]NVO12584.1 metallophosphoesterase family protein [Rhodoplanes sp.]
MRTALISDIHANREALEACLDHAERSGVDAYVFLGDYVGYGADPAWVLDTVMGYVGRGAAAVLGNHDAAAIGERADMNDDAAAAIAWTKTVIGDGHRDFLGRLPLVVEKGSILYVHANPVEPAGWGYITDLYSASRALVGSRAHITFCGHTHVPSLFHMSVTGKFASFDPVDRVDIPLTSRRRWLAVIGAVGQPRDRNPAACYAVLDDATDVLTYVRVPYDIDGAARKIIEAGLPVGLAYRLYQGY